MSSWRSLLITAVINTLLVASCGQQGPLRLPEDKGLISGHLIGGCGAGDAHLRI